MKTLLVTLMIFSILLASGFAKPSLGDDLNGKWRGYITEKGVPYSAGRKFQDTQINLSLFGLHDSFYYLP